MGNQCNAQQHVDSQFDVLPSYPAQLEVDSRFALEKSSKDLPCLLRGQGPSSVMSAAQKGHRRQAPFLDEADLKQPMWYGAAPGLMIDDDDILYPVPEPVDNTPPRTRSFWPVSSYAETRTPMKPVRTKSRHVNFANSPTHSVHRSEYGVEPYSEVYGVHPRFFDFDECGNKMPRESRSLEHPFFPREAAYSHERDFQREAAYPRYNGSDSFGHGAYTSRSAHRGNAARQSDDDLYSTPIEWGKW